jgi:hypothetical protein
MTIKDIARALDAATAHLRALVDWAERHSPVSAATRRELPVTVEVDLSGA